MEPWASLNRITGLDPAGPAFELARKEVRIDKSDANFVDIIHTNGGNENDGFLGMNNAVGHADFFPNGGHTQVGFQTERSFKAKGPIKINGSTVLETNNGGVVKVIIRGSPIAQ